MNQTTNDNQGKEKVLKSFAVVGFIGLLIIIAWLGIKLIGFAPNAFTSLASLAESVYNYKPVELVVVSNKSVANSSEAFQISWNKPKTDGEFTFRYSCLEGVSVAIRNSTGTINNVPCDTDYFLGNVNTIDISITSETKRFADVAYSIAYTRTGAKVAETTKDNAITVVNPAISAVTPEPQATTTPEVIKPVPPLPPVVTPTKPVVTVPTKPVVTPSKPVFHTVSTPIYKIPVSNPNGNTDLSVRSIGVGTIDTSNRFSLVGVIDNDYKGAIQFEIKNNGTKTSDTFTYVATLPNGATYTSDVQTALKPNERAIITVGFDTTNLIGIKVFTVKVITASDSNLNNNAFTSAASIKD